MIFSTSSFKRPKRWISAIMALVFLLNVCSPAWAMREGNYGETTSAEAFGAGFLSGAVTDISIYFGYLTGGPWGAVAAGVGSVVSNIVGVYMYYNNYEDYGKTVMSFDVFGTEVNITKGQFWSMVAGVVASCIVGAIGGAAGGAAGGVKEGVKQAGTQAVASGAKGVIVAAVTEPIKQ